MLRPSSRPSKQQATLMKSPEKIGRSSEVRFRVAEVRCKRRMWLHTLSDSACWHAAARTKLKKLHKEAAAKEAASTAASKERSPHAKEVRVRLLLPLALECQCRTSYLCCYASNMPAHHHAVTGVLLRCAEL
jgi:hypothetical protein